MQGLPITLVTASVCGLMFVWLSVRVIGGRVQNEVSIGDEGHVDLHYRIRTHANFTEYAPLFLILLGLLEVMDAHQGVLMTLAGVFIVARLLHVPGMGEGANLKFRQAGILGSFVCIAAASLYGLILGLG